MITSGIFFKNFKGSKQNSKIKKNLKKLIRENNQILQSFGKNYKELYKRWETLIKKPQNKKEFQKWKNK